MTITANVGLPGSGKSLHSVGEQICGALRERRLIVTNVPLKIRALTEYLGFDVGNLVEVLTEDNCNCEPFSVIEHFEKYEKWRSEGERGYGALFVIDECHKCFAEVTGLKANDHPIAKWFAEHRHKGCDVLLMTQDRMAIPSAIRRRVEETYLFRKLGAMGLSGSYVKLMFHGENKEALSRSFGRYKKEWFGLYYSTRAGVSERLYKGKNIFLNPRLAFIVFALIGIAIYLNGNGLHMPGSKNSPRASVEKGAAAPAGDPAKLITHPESLLAPGAEIHTAEIDALRAEVVKLKLETELAVYKSARVPQGGVLVPDNGGEGGGGVRWVDAPNVARHRLDGAELQIASYMLMGGQSQYWFTLRRGRNSEVVSSDALAQYGFRVSGVGRCLAQLRGEHGAYSVRCDGWALIGDAEAIQEAAPVQELVPGADGEVTWVKPGIPGSQDLPKEDKSR